MKQLSKYYIGIISSILLFQGAIYANTATSNELKVIETSDAIEIHTQAAPEPKESTAIPQAKDEATSSASLPTTNFTTKDTPKADSSAASPAPAAVAISTNAPAVSTADSTSKFDPLKYTLGPEDVVEIIVMRHPEFSGTYPINQEGKLQYKFVGDMDVNGLTKLQLEDKIKDIISSFVISPEVNVTVIDYKSKLFYVLGEVGQPGKYYMRSEAMPVREAVFQAGLPTASAAMRKCQIITPDKNGHAKIRAVDLYAVLYTGNLKKNLELKPGDVLYVPSTIMAKIIRVINPVASTIGIASSGPTNASSGKTAVTTLAR